MSAGLIDLTMNLFWTILSEVLIVAFISTMQMVMHGIFQLELLKQCSFSKMLEVIFIKYSPLSVMVFLVIILKSNAWE